MTKSRKPFRFVAAADGAVEILIYEQIGQTFWGDGMTARKFRDELAQHPGRAIRVRLNSPGGSVWDGLAIYGALVEHNRDEGPVTVIVDGLAASMASVIAMAGREIAIREGAMLMIHNPWTVVMGDAEAMRQEADLLDQLRDGMVNIYAARSGEDPQLLKDFMAEETWFSAQDAVDLGLADRVEQAYAPAPDEDEDEDEDEAAQALRRAAHASGQPAQLQQLWNLRDAFAHAPAACSTGSRTLALKPDSIKPNHTRLLALVRDVIKPAPSGITTETKETTMKKYAELLAAAAAETDPVKKADLLRQAAAHADCPATAQAVHLAEIEALTKPKGVQIDAEAELSRRAQIREAFKPWGEGHRALLDQCLDNMHCTVQDARAKLLSALGSDVQPLSGGSVIVLKDGGVKFKDGVQNSILARAGLGQVDPQNEFNGLTMREIARLCLQRAGRTPSGNVLDMVGAAFTTTSDFPAVLENIMTKALLRGYTEAEETFERFTRRGSLPDFKQASRAGISEFSTLDEVPEHGEYKQGKVTDRKEKLQLATYGKLFSMSRQAIINDDLAAFTDVPRKMGRAARRKVGDIVYLILTGNPLMDDGVALFDAAHANLLTAGSVLSAANLDAARTKLALQTDIQGLQNLNITPWVLVVPRGLEGRANVLVKSEADPDAPNANSRRLNIANGIVREIVGDSRLDSASATAWYLIANPAVFDTIEVAYLNGNDQPFMEQQQGWSVDGSMWKVRIDAVAKALDHRTLVKATGAA